MALSAKALVPLFALGLVAGAKLGCSFPEHDFIAPSEFDKLKRDAGAGGSAGAGGGDAGGSGAGGSAGASGDGGSGGLAAGGGASGGTASGGSAGTGATGGIPGNLTVRVVRIGDGSAQLTNASARVFVEERNLAGALIGQPIALPAAASGSQQPLTLAGNAQTEGNLSRALDGSSVVLAGYATPPGTANVAASTASAAPRVVGRIDAQGNVDTSTVLATAFSEGSVRGATTADGSEFWVSGTSSTLPSPTGGVHHVPFGTTGGTRILSAPNNARFCHVFFDQLYASSGSGAFVNVFAVGSGLPTTAGQTAIPLPGLPTSSASPYSFALLDRDGAIAGADTLYVADDRTLAAGGGIQKWLFDGQRWTLAATFQDRLGACGARGLAAAENGAGVSVVVTSCAELSFLPNDLIHYLDDGSASPAGTVIAQAGANTVFRGVALSPEP
jgi:hypothetical protein